MKIEDLTVRFIDDVYTEIWYPNGSMVGFCLQNDGDNSWHTEIFESDLVPTKVIARKQNRAEALLWLFDHLRFYLQGIPVMDRSYPRFEPEPPVPLTAPFHPIEGDGEYFEGSITVGHGGVEL